MRVVGKIQASAPNQGGAAEDIARVVEAWADSKFDARDSGVAVIRRSRVEALVERQIDELDGSRLLRFEVLEPIDGGDLQTQIKVLNHADAVHLHCTLGVTSDVGVAPPNIDMFVPRVVREIIGLPLAWQASGSAERVFGRCFEVGPEEIGQLVELMGSALRRLPLVLFSELQGRTIAGNLHTLVASDLCGLAHVCRLSKDAGWELTKREGKAWSCYNGAVRLLWPFRGNRDNPFSHPLWTFDDLTRFGDSEFEVRDRLRQRLRSMLLEASTFVADEPAFGRFARAKVEAQQARPADTTSTDDLLTLADAQIASLREALADRDRQIETLNENIGALSTRQFAQTTAPQAQDETPPETIAEALEVAKSRFASVLAFPDDLADRLAELNPAAGPPEKALRYLATLAELSRSLAAGGSIGKSIPTWLGDRNVRCSEESETKANNSAARRRRTFRVGGESVYCDLHAKPNEGVSPDQCVRIYFAPATSAPHIRIGYVGRHFE